MIEVKITSDSTNAVPVSLVIAEGQETNTGVAVIKQHATSNMILLISLSSILLFHMLSLSLLLENDIVNLDKKEPFLVLKRPLKDYGYSLLSHSLFRKP